MSLSRRRGRSGGNKQSEADIADNVTVPEFDESKFEAIVKSVTSNVLLELNKSLATKNDINDSLASLVHEIERKFEKKLAEEINKRDSIISDLNNRIGELEANISARNVAPEQCSIGDVNGGDGISGDPEASGAATYEIAAELEERKFTVNQCVKPTAETKQIVDTLLISDSLMRHVRFEDLCPQLNNMKIFLPGARCDRLLSEIVRLSSSFTFRNIIVHVGTNYIPHVYSATIANELNSFLASGFCPILTSRAPRFCRGRTNVFSAGSTTLTSL